jgi:hypothetical protein
LIPFRSTMSARAPAGSVNKKKGSEATVDNSEIINGDGVSIFIIHVAAVSWAATQIPETKAAIHSLRKIGFSKAAQVEVLVGLITIANPNVTHAACWPRRLRALPAGTLDPWWPLEGPLQHR